MAAEPSRPAGGHEGPGRPAGRHVELFQEPDGHWGWRYVEPLPDGKGAYELPSTGHYDRAEAAAKAAALAYPGVPHWHPEWDRRGRGRPARSRSGVAGAVRFGALLGLAMVALSRLRRRRRRDRRAGSEG